MSTYKARKNAAKKFGISPQKLLTTSALTAAGFLAVSASAAYAGTLEANETWEFEAGTDVTSTSTGLGHVHFDHTGSNRIIGNLVKEDICATCSVDINSALTVATGVEAGPMQLLGRLTSNGEVFVYDVNGFLFGANAVVDTQGFAAVGGTLQNADTFLTDGKMDIDVADDATITIEKGAMISAGQAGLAAFVAPFITNSGVINAKMGTVALAAGDTVTLDLYGDGLVEVAVDGELADALIENQGTIAAEGGRVQMTALAAKDAVDNIINTDGIVTVSSATQQGGKIILSGGNAGTVSVGGVVDASGTDGGDITVTGENVHVTDTATLSVDGGRGADQHGDGGTAYIYGDKYAVLEGRVSGRGGANGGDGGNAELSAGDSVGFNGVVDLGADNGQAGTFVIDPAHLFINDTYSFLGFGVGPIGTLTVYDQAIANSLANNDVKLWATETANTGSDIDVSEYDYDVLVTPGHLESCGFFCVTWVPAVYANVNGITSHDLTIAAPEVNIGHDVTLGTGALNVADILSSDSILGFGLVTPLNDIIVDHLNLDGKIYKRTALADPSFTTLADDAQINTTANTINVSNGALIQQAIHFADATDADAEDINLAAQTFTDPSQVVVDRDVNITGAGKLDTIVNPGFNTGSSGDSRGWWLVNSGTVLNLSDLTMDGNGQLVWQGIRHKGSGTIDNVLFNDIQYNPSTNYQGTAVAAFGDGTLDITNSMFTNIGRIGVLYYGAGVAGSTFSGNAYTGKGAGDWLDYALDISNGATITVSDNTISNNLGVASSDGSTSAGVLVTTYFGPGTAASFSGNTLTDNSTGIYVGYDSADSSAVTICADNVITGGKNGIMVVGENSDIVGDTLSNTVFGGQSDRFVGLYNGAEYAPNMPNVIDGTGVTWGTYGLMPTGANAIAVENMIDHYADTGADGLINFGAVVVNNNAGETTFDGSIQKGVNIAGLNGINNVVVAGSGDSYGGSVEVWADGLKIEGVNYMTNDATIDVATADAFSNIGDVNDGFVVSDSGAVGDGSDVTGVNIDPIVFSGSGDGIVLGTGGSSAIDTTIDGNTFTNSGVGVKVNNVGGTTTIKNNDIDTGSKAIQVNEKLTGDNLLVTNNTQIRGADDAIEFTQGVSGATVGIYSNASIIGDGSSSYGDAIDFRGVVDASQVTIQYNTLIQGNDDGIQFAGGIDGSTVRLFGNTVKGLNGDGIAFLDLSSFGGDDATSIGGGSSVYIGNSVIEGHGPDNDTDNKGGNGDGVLVSGKVDSATLQIGTSRITGYDDGVNLNEGIVNSTVSIFSNAGITGTTGMGVRIGNASPSVNNSTLGITGSVISGGVDGVHFTDTIDNSTVTINGNTIEGQSDDGIDFNASVVNGSQIQISGNTGILGGSSNGIEFHHVNGGSTVDIDNNNIDADDNGILFNTVNGGAVLNINDNIIRANLDNRVFGAGIYFVGDVTDATVNIGDGSLNGAPSNIISVNTNLDVGGVRDLDGILFAAGVGQDAKILIDGNRIGYTAPSLNGPLTAAPVADDGIEFRGPVSDNADIQITDNRIKAADDGIQFTDWIGDMAHVIIGETPTDADGNKIWAGDDGISFRGEVKGESLVSIVKNYIHAQSDGVLFNKKVSNAKTTGGISEQEVLISGNTIWGNINGVHFADIVEGTRQDTLITHNDIEGENGQGIVFDNTIDGAHINIAANSRIEGQADGVRFLGEVEDGALVDINDNASIEGIDEEAIHFFDEIEEAAVNIIGNHNLRAGDNGIQFGGEIDESNITISGNNHGIHADNHGILFNADVEDGSEVVINDNVIAANEDGYSIGDGIRFEGKIKDSSVQIGDGKGPDYFDDPSNIIKGVDGIHFVGDIEDGSEINIDGNRLGYYKKFNGQHVAAQLKDDGIEFDGKIEDDSSVKITDNRIKAADDGIKFNGKITDDARVLIGGYHDGNAIFAGGDGIQFGNDIEKHSLLEISYNNVDADENGIEFNGKTSNHLHSGHPEEILIKENTIEGGENGIIFYGKAEGELHDIVIRDNDSIVGHNGDGIAHTGGINDAEVWIQNNDHIFGQRDGVHVEGHLSNDAKLVISGNSDVDSGWDDGIDVRDYHAGGADVDITNNHVHHTGDNGIEVSDVDGVYIASNTVHDTGGNGIFVDPSDYIQVTGNTVYDTDEDGIHVDDGHHASIWNNWISNTGDDGIQVFDNDHVAIWGNNINGTGSHTDHGDGISVRGSDYAEIKHNSITGAGRDGINVEDSDHALIGWNDIFAQGGSWWYHNADYGQQGADRDGIHVENSDDLLVIGNDITADLGYGYYPIDQMAAGRHGIYVEGGKDIAIKYNDILGDSMWSHHSGYRSVGSVGEDGIHVEGSEDILIKKNDVSRAGDDGIQVVVKDGGDHHDHDDHHALFDFDDVNKIIIVDNNVEKSGDDGIVVNTAKEERRREEDVRRLSFDGPSDDNNGKKLFIKIAGNDVEKSGDDGIEVNLERDGNKGSDFFSPEHHDNHIEILNNKVKFSEDNGILVRLAPEKSNDHHDNHGGGKYGAPVLNILGPYSSSEEEAETIQNYIKIDGNWVAFSGNDGIKVDVKTNTKGGSQGEVAKFGAPSLIGPGPVIGPFPGFGHGDETTNTIIISGNHVAFSGDDGIDVDVDTTTEGTSGSYSPGPVLSLNAFGPGPLYPDFGGGSVKTTNTIKILGNDVAFSGDDGINVNVETTNKSTGGESGPVYGILSLNSFGPFPDFGGDTGVETTNKIVIAGNDVIFSGDDGIDVNVETKDDHHHGHGGESGPVYALNSFGPEFGGSNGTTNNFIDILGNDVTFSRDDGIVVKVDNPDSQGEFGGPGPVYDTLSIGPGFGFGGFGGNKNFVNISFNDVHKSGDDGIQVTADKDSLVNLLVAKNHVKDSGDNGILLITKGGHFGGYGGYGEEKGPVLQEVSLIGPSYYGGGYGHGHGGMNSLIVDNLVENSGSNGLYVKGQQHKHVTLKGNTFIDNPTGALFESGHVDVSDLERPNTFIVTEDFNPEGPVIGMKFDGNPWKLKIVGETLGSTVFDGFISRPVGDAFYVYFTDGSILNPFTHQPIIIDGQQANWDGVIPANLGGVLPPSVLAAIEARLWDADDPLKNGRGQIFVGRPAPDNFTIDNVEDFFNQFSPFGSGLSGLNLTITGLPPVNLGQQLLGGIQPFAGDEGVAGIEPAAGGEDGAQFANIEPAAGGGEAACWGQVFSGLANGPVNYGFSAGQLAPDGC